MFQFQHIEYLLALIAVPLMGLLYFFILKWKKNTIKKIGDERLVKQLIDGYSPSRFSLKFILVVTAFTVAVVALANPRIPNGSTTVNRNGIDVIIALDVSKSMLAEDIKPSRLERSKQLLGKLIDKLSDDRIGIVVFAGRAYMQMPLTTDHAAAKMYLSSASPEVVPTQGTVISDALKMCYSSFNSKEKKYKSVILISDGEDHDENAIKTAVALANEGIMINTIGIGSPGGANIKDPATNDYKRDAEGNTVVTKLNEEELREIAEKGNGTYQLFTNADDIVKKLLAQLKGIGQREVTEKSLINYTNYFPFLLAFSLLLLLIEPFIAETRRKRNNNNSSLKQGLVTAMFVFAGIASSFAQSNNSIINKGNQAYKEGKFSVAADSYKKVTEKEPANTKAQYNLGNAFYKAGKSEDALQAYDASIKNTQSKKEKAAAFYNKGVVLQNNKKLPECIDAYKNALRLNPADEDTRLNLQKALQQQKQQQQKEQDKEKPKDDKQKQDKNKNQEPKPQPSKMTKQEAEEKLKALLQQEKNLQDKLRKVNAASPEKPEKDW